MLARDNGPGRRPCDKISLCFTPLFGVYTKFGIYPDVITDPKTPKSRRKVQLPDFLCEELQDYLSTLDDLGPSDRIFPVYKNYLYRKMKEGAERAGLKRIRVHDLRHSHISLLINMGFSAIEIADRVGHESIDITYRYAHLFPNTQKKIANQLNIERTAD